MPMLSPPGWALVRAGSNIYFYSSNILKNLHLLMPDNPVIRFLDYFIGLQFTRKVAWLEEFLKKEQQGAGAD